MPRTLFGRAVLTALLFATAGPAQDTGDAQVATLTVNPGTLQRGSSAQIRYRNPQRAGETVLVEIDNGLRRNPQSTAIEITLDANGEGSASWVVPDWLGANFNAPDVPETFCPIAR